MRVYFYGWSYVCWKLMRPVATEMLLRHHNVHITNLWGSDPQLDKEDFETFLNSEGKRVLVVTGDWDQPGHALPLERLHRAHAAGIPVLCITHSYLAPCIDVEMLADVTCLWGKHDLQYAKAKQPVITGNPALDNRPHNPEALYRVNARMGMPGWTSFVLFAGSPPGDRCLDYLPTEQQMRDAVWTARQRFPVVVRPHPAFDPKQYSFLTELRNVFLWPGDTETCGQMELMQAARCVIGNSTVLVEAACIGTPVLWLSRNLYPAVIDDVISFQYKTGSDIYRAILYGKPSPEFVDQHNTGNGGAAFRIASTIEGLGATYVDYAD